jgi:hypothetical protein
MLLKWQICIMRKIKLLIITIFFMANLVSAQNSNNIVGLYNLGSSSPEGGSHLFVLENGNYAITYFGGIQTGKWEFTKDAVYRFTPNIRGSKFELFGRYNKDLKDSTKIFFSGFENSQTFIQLRTTKEEEYRMQQVFNTDANCFSFPYIKTFKTNANSISLMFDSYEQGRSPIISFKNPEGYNDFVANFIEVDSYNARPFFATFKDDKLYFKDKNYSQRKPLDEDSEDITFIKKMIDKEMDRDTINLNPSYNGFGQPDSEEEDQDIHEHHVFNKEKNAFIDKEYYVEGEEHIKADDSFDNMSIIYAYKILKEYIKKSVKYKIDESPIFQVNCD